MPELENKLLNEKIDKLQSHFTTYKTDIVDVKENVKELTTAIIGSSYTGSKGLIHLVDSMCKDIEDLKRKNALKDEDIKNVKYASGVLFTALVTGFVSFVIWVFTK
jgi:hypothetical protein